MKIKLKKESIEESNSKKLVLSVTASFKKTIITLFFDKIKWNASSKVPTANGIDDIKPLRKTNWASVYKATTRQVLCLKVMKFRLCFIWAISASSDLVLARREIQLQNIIFQSVKNQNFNDDLFLTLN
jgi:hypothetical protein